MHQIIIKETHNHDRLHEPLQFGIPLSESLFKSSDNISLINNDGSVLDCFIKPLTFWPNGSIKWCLINTIISIKKNSLILLTLKEKPSNPSQKKIASCIELIKETGQITVSTKNAQFSFNTKKFNLFDHIIYKGNEIVSHGICSLKTLENIDTNCQIIDTQIENISSTNQSLSSVINLQGFFKLNDNDKINISIRLIFHYNNDTVTCSSTLHNSKSAKHLDGLWDLGDEHSLYFNELKFAQILTSKNEILCKTTPSEDWIKTESNLKIQQHSSGGDNWNSPIHKNKDGDIPFDIKGYELTRDNHVSYDKRAQPIVSIRTEHTDFNISINKFWQKFPKALSVDNNDLTISLFPTFNKGAFELQPGEKSSNTFHISLNSSTDNDLFWTEYPLDVSINPLWVRQTKAVLFPHYDKESATNQIIKQGLTSTNNFFKKREKIDEYGWRNFGEIYADHETDLLESDELFISHYNNQYDPLYGFLRQFMFTSNQKWLELAHDLAQHIIDIDIYHTDEDRSDYNHGLFWHTDHYLDAETATHRTYSKHHKNNAYDDHAGGGGPAGQHCYTRGLLYYYLLTGNPIFKDTVFSLTNWITQYYEGSGTLLDTLVSLKNKNRADLKQITTGLYPLDRGTGNYINSLLDSYSLNLDLNYIHQVELVIKHTVHPLDNLDNKALDDVENNWFYTVFFQAVGHYLIVKLEQNNLDESFYYARDSLLHYALWMTKNEAPYLENSNTLEFPNYTWTAQDIRKAYVLALAHYFSPNSDDNFKLKSDSLYNYIAQTLSVESTRTYTRILSILMQNDGAEYLLKNKPTIQFSAVNKYQPPVKQTKLNQFVNILKAFLSAIKSTSIKKELLWLRQRT